MDTQNGAGVSLVLWKQRDSNTDGECGVNSVCTDTVGQSVER